ncbi:MAG: alanyl-tRNA editing protein AlaXM [archaeon]
MTELLYMKDSYLKEFEATVTKVEGKIIVLDKTAFYPQGGGVPDDRGKLVSGDKSYYIRLVKKMGDVVIHEVDEFGLQVGDRVRGWIDWERRYKLMRMHTAAHIFSAVVNRETGALITGNQIDLDRTRIDFDLESFDREKLAGYLEITNAEISKNQPITIEFLPREKVMEIPGIVKLAGALPPSINELRTVKIGDVDIQADGGPHVANTSEIGKIEIIDTENKGKNNRRVYFKLI